MDFYVQTSDIVEYGRRVTEPYKAVNRTVHPDDTHIQVGGVTIGEGYFSRRRRPMLRGERSADHRGRADREEERRVNARGGAFKPRTSPYSFQGLQEDGLKFLLAAKKATGLPVVTEVMNQTQLPLFEDVDVIQVGARNMQNYDLLKEIGRCKKPVVLKRGFSSTIEEFLMSAEYIVSEGNPNVILCERGIRTFETMTRNTLDLSAVPLLKQKSHLPVIVDPSHAAGLRSLVPALSKAAVAVSADGLMIETHNDPSALSDGAQSLDLDQFAPLRRPHETGRL